GLLRAARQAERDVLRDRAPGEQSRLLEGDRGRVVVRAGRLAVERDAARGRRIEAADEAQQRRLAAARGADDGDDLARREVGRDAAQRRGRALGGGEGALDVREAHGARRRAVRGGVGGGHALQNAGRVSRRGNPGATQRHMSALAVPRCRGSVVRPQIRCGRDDGRDEGLARGARARRAPPPRRIPRARRPASWRARSRHAARRRPLERARGAARARGHGRAAHGDRIRPARGRRHHDVRGVGRRAGARAAGRRAGLRIRRRRADAPRARDGGRGIPRGRAPAARAVGRAARRHGRRLAVARRVPRARRPVPQHARRGHGQRGLRRDHDGPAGRHRDVRAVGSARDRRLAGGAREAAARAQGSARRDRRRRRRRGEQADPRPHQRVLRIDACPRLTRTREGMHMVQRQFPKPREVMEFLKIKMPEFGKDARLKKALTISDLRKIAKRRTPAAAFDYTDGAADHELSMQRARRAVGDTESRPDTLTPAPAVATATQTLGGSSAMPFGIAPTGFTRLMQTEGETAGAGAAGAAGIPFTLSTLGTTSIEDVKKANPNGRNWFQLYVMRDREISYGLVERAAKAGFDTLQFTVDTPIAGNRMRDSRNGFSIPPQLSLGTIANAIPRPWWWIDFLTTPKLEFASLSTTGGTVGDLLNAAMDPTISYDDLATIREMWPGKIVIKG